MAQARGKRLLKRAVVGPKGPWVEHPKTGNRYQAVEGDIVSVTAHQAKTFAHCLVDPKVQAAQAAAKEAEAEANAEIDPSDEGDNEGGSDES